MLSKGNLLFLENILSNPFLLLLESFCHLYDGISGVPACQQEVPYCVIDLVSRNWCETWCDFIQVSLYVIVLRLWQVEHVICPAEPPSSVLGAHWLTHTLPPFSPSLFSSPPNEVSTLMMFFLVVLILLTWHVTPHCSSLRGYLRFTTAVNLPQ